MLLQNGPEPSRARRQARHSRTLDGEDRSEMIDEEGKDGVAESIRFLKRQQAKRMQCACVNHGSI